MKAIARHLLVTMLILTLTACSGAAAESATGSLASAAIAELVEPTIRPGESGETASTASIPMAAEYEQDDLSSSTSGSEISYITLEGEAITVEGTGVTVDGTAATITAPGVYSITGKLCDGQIIVDTEGSETVVLVLNGADITCSSGAPIYIRNAEKTVISLADGTENYVADGAAYILEDAESDDPNAAIFSKDDLTINGSGSLTVQANYNNGIASKDDLKITGGTITIVAENDGIKGRDSIAIRDGTITVTAGGDGLQSNNDEDPERGYVLIEGGALDITAGQDGVQAQTRLVVSGGNIDLLTGGSSAMASADSAKGLKAGVDVTITGGVIHIDSEDDAIHSNDSISILGGDIRVASGDDAVHADSSLLIGGGELDIVGSYEGLESQAITINDGVIHVVASDDGINGSTGGGGGGMGGRMGGFGGADCSLTINGGYIAVDARGDGMDINGPVQMTGGVVIVNGPTANNNGALDYSGSFNLTGGYLVAVGSAGMAQAPSTGSTQYSVMYNFPSMLAAGTIVRLETGDGEEVLTLAPTKAYQSLVFSSPELKSGTTLVVHTGGRSTGTVNDSVYTGGAYSGGTEVASFTISNIVTGAGTMGGRFGGGPDGALPSSRGVRPRR